MTRPRATLTAVLTATTVAAGLAGAAPAPASGAGGQPTRLLVVMDGASHSRAHDAVHAAAGAAMVRRLDEVGVDIVQTDDPAAALARYRADPRVKAVSVDGRVHAMAAPADEGYGEQWNLHPVSASNQGTANWEPVAPLEDSTVASGIKVAVLDSGLRLGGADQPRFVESGACFMASGGCAAGSSDDFGHGTHVAGTIAQRTNNLKVNGDPGFEGVAGVAPRTTIIPIKVLDAQGGGFISDLVTGINHAVNVGAHVINMSLGGAYDQALCNAVRRASRSAVVVAATGNDGRVVYYPAACPGAVAVGALAYDGSKTPYSNASCETSMAAPGGDSTRDRFDPGRSPGSSGALPVANDSILQETFLSGPGTFGYYWKDGTSMAAAHVAAAAALVLEANPALTSTEVAKILKATARDLHASGPDDASGYGALDIARAVQAASQAGPALAERGYWLLASDGGIFSYGGCFSGSTGGLALKQPIVGMAPTPDGAGYWLVASDGGVFAFPATSTPFHGSTGAMQLNQPIVAMAATPTGNGYWLAAADGGVFAFGDARPLGSMGGTRLAAPVVGMVATSTGDGYWLVASDGGIFAFGDAVPRGSMGGKPLNQPVVGMARTPSGNGYWLVARDGGVFAFGDAEALGSMGGRPLNLPVVGMAATPDEQGYWLVASDGGIFAFGGRFRGSTGNIKLNRPIVGMAVAPDRS